MVDTEEYFPRGGKKPTTTYFKKSGNFLGGIEKGEKKKKKIKRKTEGDDGYLSDEAAWELDQSQKYYASGISFKTVKPGVLLLGRVKHIHETKLMVSVPRMTGAVMACHISEPYNKLLEAYVDDKIDKIRELPQIFCRGQFVVVKVLEVEKNKLMLSVMPQHVNGTLTHNDLHNGALLQAAVSSVEDHGCVMDLGIPNTRAFLPNSNKNPEIDLDTGMVTWVIVKNFTPSSDNSVVTLSNELSALQLAFVRNKPNTILPGSSIDFVVEQPLETGIEGHVFGDMKAYIPQNQIDTVKGKKPSLGQKFRARVLYVMPTRKTPFLTMKNIFSSTFPDMEEEQKFQEGEIVEDAQVLKILGRLVIFRLGRKSTGFMSLRHVQVDENLSDEQVLEKSYPIGSTHKVRIMQYNLIDYNYLVSDHTATLNEKYFSIHDLSVAEMVSGTVVSIADSHMLVNVGRITGLVPNSHLSDAGIFVDPKKASNSKIKKKFKVGQEVKARILAIDTEKSNLTLTLKPSLLAPNLDILQSYDDANIGKEFTGVVKTIREYLLVSFFGSAVALVPHRHVSADPIGNLTEAFHLGQIVKCTILKVDVENKKMIGSLTTAPFTPGKKIERIAKRKQVADELENPKKQKKNDEELKKDKKKNKQNINDEATEYTEKENKNTKKKKKEKMSLESDNNIKIEEKQSEESDAIETDIYEDGDQVLSPQELELIDLSDCTTPKKYKKRVVSLLKAIKSRTTRIAKIEKKLGNIEGKGLDSTNKKFHTAMHMEKMVIEERLKKLMETLVIVQDKFNEFGVVSDVDYKKDKKEKKMLKKEKQLQENEAKSMPKSKNKDSDNTVESNSKTIRKVKKDKDTTVDKEADEGNRSLKIKTVPIVGDLAPVLEVPSAKDFWAVDADTLSQKVQEEETSSSDDEEQELPKKKRKKLSVAEKLSKARAEEQRLRDMETRAVESESQPRSCDQFERALLANPNSSQLWIAYMAFHLQATEVDKARAVARKALNTISFREEDEKLNVWLAMLNCEHRFGTKESQQKTLEEALQMNETYKIHSQLLDILVETSKQQELSTLVDLMLKKYRRKPEAYIACGTACFAAGLVDKARNVMQKAVAALEKKEHVSILVQFAILERSHGASERAEALFEQILAVYPQRTDVCNVYVDSLAKAANIDGVRQVMERMTSQKLPARKMKILYRKWIEVEEKIGSKDQAESIRQRAMEFIDKAKF